MKNLTYLTAIATTAISLLLPATVKAQSTTIQSFPQQGYSSTTIYVPTQQPTTTTPLSPNLYPSNESYIQTDSGYRDRSSRQRYRQSTDPTIIIVRPNSNSSRAVPSRCTTSIVGSPIPSPIAIDRITGQPCQ
jgi:hypothetical protein